MAASEALSKELRRDEEADPKLRPRRGMPEPPSWDKERRNVLAREAREAVAVADELSAQGGSLEARSDATPLLLPLRLPPLNGTLAVNSFFPVLSAIGLAHRSGAGIVTAAFSSS